MFPVLDKMIAAGQNKQTDPLFSSFSQQQSLVCESFQVDNNWWDG